MIARYGCIRKRVLLKVDINGHLILLDNDDLMLTVLQCPLNFQKIKQWMTIFLNPEEWHSTSGSAALNHVKINKNRSISEAEMCSL